MLIPIQLEGETYNSPRTRSNPSQTTVAPVITFPTESTSNLGLGILRPREKIFGDILHPVLSKYLQLRDSKRKDLQSLLLKEHPFHVENFKSNGDKYELHLNVQKFKPEEIHVKINDDSVSILGEHEENAGRSNYTKQQFIRRYCLPDKVNSNDIVCELNSDGYLVISAPKMDQKVKITEIPSLPIDCDSKEEEPVKSI